MSKKRSALLIEALPIGSLRK